MLPLALGLLTSRLYYLCIIPTSSDYHLSDRGGSLMVRDHGDEEAQQGKSWAAFELCHQYNLLGSASTFKQYEEHVSSTSTF